MNATIFLDTSRFGNTPIFNAHLPYEWRGRVSVGDTLWVVDDGVDPFLCQVIRVFNDGKSARFEQCDKPEEPRYVKATNLASNRLEWLLILDNEGDIWSYDPVGTYFYRNPELKADFYGQADASLGYEEISKDEAKRLANIVPKISNKWWRSKAKSGETRYLFEQAFGEKPKQFYERGRNA